MNVVPWPSPALLAQNPPHAWAIADTPIVANGQTMDEERALNLRAQVDF